MPPLQVAFVRPKEEMFKFLGINLSARDKDFSTKTLFKSREELLEWTQNTARSLGYVIVTRRSKAYGNSFAHTVILICDCGREYKPKEYTSRTSGSKKTNCQFQLEGKYSKEHDKWTLRVICDEHNHPPTQHMEGHPFARRLSVDETRLVANLRRKNMAPRDILSALKAQNENNVSTIKTIYNAQQKIRMHEQAGRIPMQIWRAFPHVLIIDATYKTNKYNKPLVQIVGVTSTQKAFSVGFAFIHREKEANYTWVLNCLNSTLDTCMHPHVIITDRELALIKACETIFLDVARLLCRWHIEQNILKHCNKIITLEDDRRSFRSLWNLLIESPTLMDYTKNYMRLQSMLIKYPCVLKYIEDTWLNKYKEMLVSVWIDQHLNFGNNTTNRVESAHANLKRFLDSASSNLDRFMQRINEIVQSQLTSINESFEKSLIFRYKHHNSYCFGLLRGSVSNEALDIIVGELQRLNLSKLDSSNCGCKLRTSCGLPCACMLSVYLNSGEEIPLDLIHIFWRKLSISDTKPEKKRQYSL
ncbi:protein FAR1-RELATED SEQUENCE 5-like [Lactuca sativa]|uniref:protein FAR1-RELATED SEQUENCE 5-like n=1 Tax=Lactuca sativa TaxID=4236 RepID=UPI0022AE9A9B|nr:protein FAR1-RELATED SEQUENCE 5-like [Lactuca sativa]